MTQVRLPVITDDYGVRYDSSLELNLGICEAMPNEVILDRGLTYNQRLELAKQANTWCLEQRWHPANVTLHEDGFHYYDDQADFIFIDGIHFLFRDRPKAMLFKLTWC